MNTFAKPVASSPTDSARMDSISCNVPVIARFTASLSRFAGRKKIRCFFAGVIREAFAAERERKPA